MGTFDGTWKTKALHRHMGQTDFLENVDSYTVSHTTKQFTFKFKISGSEYTATMTEGNNSDFSGSVTVGNDTYKVEARKFSSPGNQSKDFINGVIGKPDLNKKDVGYTTPTDLMSFTAIKTG